MLSNLLINQLLTVSGSWLMPHVSCPYPFFLGHEPGAFNHEPCILSHGPGAMNHSLIIGDLIIIELLSYRAIGTAGNAGAVSTIGTKE